MTSSPVERPPNLRDRQRAAVRADIHAAAYRLFAAKGFANVTTDDIAAEAAISPQDVLPSCGHQGGAAARRVQRAGAAIAALLERRPSDESPDVAAGRGDRRTGRVLRRRRSAELARGDPDRTGAARPGDAVGAPPTATSHGRTRRRAHGADPAEDSRPGSAGPIDLSRQLISRSSAGSAGSAPSTRRWPRSVTAGCWRSSHTRGGGAQRGARQRRPERALMARGVVGGDRRRRRSAATAAAASDGVSCGHCGCTVDIRGAGLDELAPVGDHLVGQRALRGVQRRAPRRCRTGSATPAHGRRRPRKAPRASARAPARCGR